MDKCSYNKNLRCWLRRDSRLNCPRDNEDWIEIVDRWALGREPGCVDWASVRGTKQATDEALVALCDINQVLRLPDAVMGYCGGFIEMNEAVCKDLLRGELIWKALNSGFTRISEEKRLDKKYPELNKPVFA